VEILVFSCSERPPPPPTPLVPFLIVFDNRYLTVRRLRPVDARRRIPGCRVTVPPRHLFPYRCSSEPDVKFPNGRRLRTRNVPRFSAFFSFRRFNLRDELLQPMSYFPNALMFVGAESPASDFLCGLFFFTFSPATRFPRQEHPFPGVLFIPPRDFE